jgi:hypothetical protein
MEIDLANLREMHKRLPADIAFTLVQRASLALQRNGHLPGAQLFLDFDRKTTDGLLSWQKVDPRDIAQHDHNRITEDGAEAVALAVAHRHREWRVVRRLQREEHADWLLEAVQEGKRQTIAMEVSGVARGAITARLVEKRKQVALCVDVDQRCAGVVGFQEPTAALHTTKRRQHGR